MSLTAMLSLSSSSSTHPPKLLDFYQRIPFQGKLRRNSQGNYKPQHLHFRLYGVRASLYMHACNCRFSSWLTELVNCGFVSGRRIRRAATGRCSRGSPSM